MKITVTAEDIAQGKPTDACACPIWFAVVRALPHLLEGNAHTSVTIGPLGVICTNGFKAPLPLSALRWMSDFDADQPVEPFEFDLDVAS